MTEPDSTQLTTGLDWSTEEISDEEWESLAKWYEESHGIGDLQFVRFVPFMLANRPDALKRYRRWVEAIPAGSGLEGPVVPAPGMAMIFCHLYTNLGYGEGIIYTMIAARGWGATKAQIQELLSLAWLHAGPLGMNAAAEAAEQYLSEWPDDDVEGGGIDWPDGWTPAPELFQAGLDYGTATFTGEERQRLERWHLDWQGEVPPHVEHLATHYPLALKIYRERYETAIRGALPKQLMPLLELHLALLQSRPDAARRAAIHARALGVTRAQLVQVATSSQVYLGATGMDVMVQSLGDLLEGWDSQA